MESKRQSKLGEIIGYGELTAGEVALKKIREHKIINPKNPVPKHPFMLRVEAGGNAPVVPYVQARVLVALEAPIDLSEISIIEAYEEAKEIVLAMAKDLLDDLKRGILLRDDPKKGGLDGGV